MKDNKFIMNNISIFDVMHPDYKIDKPIRLIELFAGVGSQAMALRNIGADFEHYRISEWEVSATASYKAIHMENDNTDYSLEIEIAKLPKVLFDYGISKDGKEPMTLEEIERKGEKWQRITYNNLRATNNLGSICNFKGEDLEIVDTDSFTYLLTYSFPCQDLSVAGKMQGMTKGDKTRSGLLWEVERLLTEVENLPQVLLMENVPQVISDANIKDFHLWQKFLEEKGYSNYTEILNAKDYGVAQNRERCFMVSLLGEWNYKFPKPIPLTKTMKDYLENEVDEKYYIKSEKAQKLIQQLIETKQLINRIECADGSINDPKIRNVSNCIKARYDAGISNLKSDGGVVIEVNQLGNITPGTNRENPNQGRVYDKNALAPTLSCMGGGNREPMIVIMTELQPRDEGISNTLTTVQKDNLLLEPSVKIKQATKEGYIECKLGGVADLSYPNSKTRRGRVQSRGQISPTITATETGICRIETPYRIRKLTPLECWRLMGFTDEDFYKAKFVFENEQSLEKLTREKFYNILYSNLSETKKLYHIERLKIKTKERTSNTQLYKQAGNSIVVKVLEAIFKQML